MGLHTLIYGKEGPVATIGFNRPESLNAINMEVLIELSEVLDDIKADDSIRVVILKGNEQVFAAGADIRDFMNYGPLEVRNYIQMAHHMGNKLNDLPQATIASIAGFAVGGGWELAMSCDLRIAADNALFGLPEINLGLFPAGGGTQRLTRLVGYSRAKEIILTGDLFDSQKALAMGVVSQVVPSHELNEATQKLARKLSRKPPVAVQMIKELLDLSQHLDPHIGVMMEREKFAVLFATEDKNEGIQAFLEGRKAVFKGK